MTSTATISRSPHNMRIRGHQEAESILNVRVYVIAERLILGSESCCQHASKLPAPWTDEQRNKGVLERRASPRLRNACRAQTSPIAASASVSAGGTARGLDALAQKAFGEEDGRHAQQACCYLDSFLYPSSTLSQGDKPPSCRLPQGWNMRACQDDTGPCAAAPLRPDTGYATTAARLASSWAAARTTRAILLAGTKAATQVAVPPTNEPRPKGNDRPASP